MTDFYLRADTQAEIENSLVSAGIATLDGDGLLVPVEGVAIDVIGEIVNLDMTDPTNPVPVEQPGWHVNIRAVSLTEEQIALISIFSIVPPNTPYRVWA